MLKCARTFPRPFSLCIGILVTTAAIGMAQESASPPKAAEESPKPAATEVAPSQNVDKPDPAESGPDKTGTDKTDPEQTMPSSEPADLVTEMPSWGTDFKDGDYEDNVPVLTEPCDSYKAAKDQLDDAIKKAFAKHLDRKLVDPTLAARLTPPASDLRNRFTMASPFAVVKTTKDGKDCFVAATRLDIPDHAINFIVENYYRQKYQLAAIQKTGFIGAGMLGLVFILAVSARLDHAFGGKRSGILRAASTVAILSLFVGLFITAVLGRVFTS